MGAEYPVLRLLLIDYLKTALLLDWNMNDKALSPGFSLLTFSHPFPWLLG